MKHKVVRPSRVHHAIPVKPKSVSSTNWGKHDPLLEHLSTDKTSYPQGGVTRVDIDKVIKSVPGILDEIFGRKGDQ